MSGNITYSIVDNDGHYEIARITAMDCGHEISLNFSPPVPNLTCLKDGVTIRGRFSAGADETMGIVAGEYWLSYNGVKTELVMQPTKGWQPMLGRSWVRSYRWCANIEASNKGKVTVESKWTRK